MFSRPVFAGNLCLFAVLALSAAVFSAGCEMNVSESPVLDEIEAAYRGLQGGGVILPGTSGSAPDGAPGGNAGNGGQTGGYPQHKPGEVFTDNGITYLVTEDGTGLEIRGGRPDENGILRIPPEVYGLPVVRIGRDYDGDVFHGNQSIKTLDLSGCKFLTEIAPYAFQNCSALTKVDLSGCTALRTIGALAFNACSSLDEVHLCGSLGSLALRNPISSDAFYPGVRIYVLESDYGSASAVLVSWMTEICTEHSSFPSP